MKITKKKIAAVVGAGTLAIGAGGVAYAYWTTTGTGTGEATSALTASAGVTIASVGDLTGFRLGDSKPVVVTATNNASSSQKIGAVTVTVGKAGDCAANNWQISDPRGTFATLAATGSQGATSSRTEVATLTLLDLPTNQDACKGVTPPLTFTAAQGS